MSPERPILLDYNATTPILPEVVDAMLPWLREHFGNPSSGHVYGRRAHDAVERARAQVAALLGCDVDELIFTSGGTEANGLALAGLTEARPERTKLVISGIEHPAVTRPCERLAARGASLSVVGVDADGVLRLDACAAALDASTALVSVMHSNNETGVLQPLEAVVALARRVGALVHTDAAQSLGKVPVDVKALGVDALSLAGHKLYAPKGVGALYVKRGTALVPQLLGAGHEHGRRAGTENVASLVGLGVACALAREQLAEVSAGMRARRERLWDGLRGRIDGLVLNGHPEARLPNTLSVRFPGVGGTALLAAAPGLAASTGSACHDGGEAASAVILAMGVPAREALGTVRLSLGRGTTDADVEGAVEALALASAVCRAG